MDKLRPEERHSLNAYFLKELKGGMMDTTNYEGIEKTDAVKLVEAQAEITRLRAENERLITENAALKIRLEQSKVPF